MSRVQLRIVTDVLSKALNYSKLVRVQRPTSRNGKTYMAYKWVRPDKVKKTDKVVGNAALYEKWENEKKSEAAPTPRNPMANLKAKKAKKGTATPNGGTTASVKPNGSKKTDSGGTKTSPTKPKTSSKPDSGYITDSQLESIMNAMKLHDVKLLIATGKLKLTDAQQARVDAWEAAEKQTKERFEGAGLTSQYRSILSKRYSEATPEARKAFDKYAVRISDCIANCHTKDACYKVYQDRIYFDAFDDSIVEYDRRPPGSTLQHELGHLIDFRAKEFTGEFDGINTVSNEAEFLDAIRTDVNKAEEAMREKMMQTGLSNIPINVVRHAISAEMIKEGAAATAGVQDIFGGVIKKRYPGARFRHYESYWRCTKAPSKHREVMINERLGTEAFAQMYEACSNEKAAAAMEKWLPNAFKRFKEILKEITTD